MLHWWDREGSMSRAIDPLAAELAAGLIDPVVAVAFSFDRAADANRFIHERSNVGKVVLVP
jgi:NADPH:quinone reductase-like Zn-dependent oxidoreductase